jgi:hypothetical protein
MRHRTALPTLLALLVGLTPGLALAEKPAVTATGTATGILDLETLPHGTATIVRDNAYSVEFPWKPNVSQVDTPVPSGGKLASAMALATEGDLNVGLMLVPVPKDLPYDAKAGLNGTATA